MVRSRETRRSRGKAWRAAPGAILGFVVVAFVLIATLYAVFGG